jgi:uncharacterized protein (UPF0335 family)
MKKFIIITIFVFIGAAIIFYRSNVKREVEYKKAIDSLNHQIDLREDSIIAFREQVEIFVEKVHRAETQLQENKLKIKKIYKEYEIHLLSVDSYDIDELERFFANRYKDSTSTEY